MDAEEDRWRWRSRLVGRSLADMLGELGGVRVLLRDYAYDSCVLQARMTITVPQRWENALQRNGPDAPDVETPIGLVHAHCGIAFPSHSSAHAATDSRWRYTHALHRRPPPHEPHPHERGSRG